jgi:hypothetical protein
MTNLLRLLYVSIAQPDLGDEGIATILVTARERNEAASITGVLTYRAGRFAQILEGPELNVLDTYMRIARDSRHSSPTLVTISMTTDRRFDGWFMGGIIEEESPLDTAEILALGAAARQDTDTDATALLGRWLAILQSQPVGKR